MLNYPVHVRILLGYWEECKGVIALDQFYAKGYQCTKLLSNEIDWRILFNQNQLKFQMHWVLH